MSSMEVFIGQFRESKHNIEPEDTDDFYDLEEEHNCYFVKVNGKLYEFWSEGDYDSYGFDTFLPPSDLPYIVCYWYNGGAGIHEVAESAIKSYLEK
jgi:hypothetical protein